MSNIVETEQLPQSSDIFSGKPWSDTSPHPWRRFLARSLDTPVNAMILIIPLSIIFSLIDENAADQFFLFLENPLGRVLDVILTVFLATVFNAVLIGKTGGSLGKWLFGVRVIGDNYKPIGFRIAFKRELLVLLRGLGLGIPIVNLVTMGTSFETLNKEGATYWDRKLNSIVVHRDHGLMGTIISIIGVIFIILLVIGTRGF